jgi:hypothetical protein
MSVTFSPTDRLPPSRTNPIREGDESEVEGDTGDVNGSGKKPVITASPAAQALFDKVLSTASKSPDQKAFSDFNKNNHYNNNEPTFEVNGDTITAYVPNGNGALPLVASYNSTTGEYRTGDNGEGSISAKKFNALAGDLNSIKLLPMNEQTNPSAQRR